MGGQPRKDTSALGCFRKAKAGNFDFVVDRECQCQLAEVQPLARVVDEAKARHHRVAMRRPRSRTNRVPEAGARHVVDEGVLCIATKDARE